jgi:hypothetical protein
MSPRDQALVAEIVAALKAIADRVDQLACTQSEMLKFMRQEARGSAHRTGVYRL